ncbi:hypothetical protein SAG0099_03810 [Streptococcus agalactiae BSU247]|nr:hypothetical protein SAG0099_03810 [Streptococcus agalactiae BSU247]
MNLQLFGNLNYLLQEKRITSFYYNKKGNLINLKEVIYI